METKLSADFVRDIFRTMNVGLVVQDRNGHIVEVNSAAERVLGLTFDQLRGRSSIDPRWRAIHEDGSDFPGDTHPASVTLATGKSQIAVPMGIHKPNGSITWIEVTSHPHFLGDNPKPNSVATTFTDITRWMSATRPEVTLASLTSR